MGGFLSPTKDKLGQTKSLSVLETRSQVIIVLDVEKQTKTKRPRCTLFIGQILFNSGVCLGQFLLLSVFWFKGHKNNVGSTGEGALAPPALAAFRPTMVESQISQVLKRENRAFCQLCNTCFRLAFLPHRFLRHLTVFV